MSNNISVSYDNGDTWHSMPGDTSILVPFNPVLSPGHSKSEPFQVRNDSGMEVFANVDFSVIEEVPATNPECLDDVVVNSHAVSSIPDNGIALKTAEHLSSGEIFELPLEAKMLTSNKDCNGDDFELSVIYNISMEQDPSSTQTPGGTGPTSGPDQDPTQGPGGIQVINLGGKTTAGVVHNSPNVNQKPGNLAVTGADVLTAGILSAALITVGVIVAKKNRKKDEQDVEITQI